MNKHLFLLGIVVMAFSISLDGVSAYDFFTQFPEVEIAEISEDIFCPTGCNLSGGKIEIDYKHRVQGKELNNGVCVITNLTNKSIYYLSYERNKHIENRIKEISSLICYMGTKEFEISPSESATFEISVPRNKKTFEVGFDFKVEGRLISETTWKDVEEQRFSC